MVLGDTKVRRIHTEHGYHHEPELDPEWSELMQLRWHAAVASIDTAPLRIRVQSAIGWSKRNGITDTAYAYAVSIPGSGFGVGSMTFDHAWSHINDVRLGIEIERRRTERIAASSEPTPIFDRLVTRFAIERALRIPGSWRWGCFGDS